MGRRRPGDGPEAGQWDRLDEALGELRRPQATDPLGRPSLPPVVPQRRPDPGSGRPVPDQGGLGGWINHPDHLPGGPLLCLPLPLQFEVSTVYDCTPMSAVFAIGEEVERRHILLTEVLEWYVMETMGLRLPSTILVLTSIPLAPLYGPQSAAQSWAGLSVTLNKPDPSAFTTQTSRFPPPSEVKAIRVPSGDQAGL